MQPKLRYFLVCEDVRLEQKGLLTLSGFVSGPTLNVSGPGLMPKVAFLLAFSGMKGIEDTRVTIEVWIGPTLLLRNEGARNTRSNPAVDDHVEVNNVVPFPVTAEGEYIIKLAVQFGKKHSAIYTHRLTLKFAPPPPS